MQLETDLEVDQKTAWFILHRVRAMYERSAPKELRDVVQLDETLVGGKARNKHADKRKPGTQGRSTVDKTIVFGARGICGRIKTEVVPNVEADTLVPIVEKWVPKGAIMVTDELRSYRALNENYFHIAVDHSAGQYTTGAFSSNGVENFWSLFKRGIIGIYHQVSPKHLHRYSTEFAYRYNTRKLSAYDRFVDTLKNAKGVRLKFKDLIKD